MIEKYFIEIDKTISYFKDIRSYSLNKKIYNDRQGFVSGTIIFDDDSQLDFTEVKNVELEGKIKYRYHYMDKDNELIFRYDNANHYKDIKNCPHHKHLKETIIESPELNLFDILLEIKEIIR
ncbi:MAG: toxin-antitoxin system TumE family protein [Candidatus Anammoxibacter sp.]